LVQEGWEIAFSNVKLGYIIGRGSFGTIYRARLLGAATVAVKKVEIMVPDLRTKVESMLRRELKVVQGLEHPHVICIYGVVLDQGTWVGLVMELAPRGSLRQILDTTPKQLLQNQAAQHATAAGVASGMACLHACTPRVLHHDLKSANVLLFGEDPASLPTAKIADFGLSDLGETSAQLRGTPAFLPPESITRHPEGVYTHESEVYSFGVLLWELVTAKRPWDGYDRAQLLRAISRHERPPFKDTEAKGLLGQLAARCWVHDARARPTFAQVETEMRSYLPPSARGAPSERGHTRRRAARGEHAFWSSCKTNPALASWAICILTLAATVAYCALSTRRGRDLDIAGAAPVFPMPAVSAPSNGHSSVQ
jgi:serine/threonine protein kinase